MLISAGLVGVVEVELALCLEWNEGDFDRKVENARVL